MINLAKYSEKQLNGIVKVVTNESDVNWHCRILENKISIGNDYFDKSEFFEIREVEYEGFDYIEISLNYVDDTFNTFEIGQERKFKDFDKK